MMTSNVNNNDADADNNHGVIFVPSNINNESNIDGDGDDDDREANNKNIETGCLTNIISSSSSNNGDGYSDGDGDASSGTSGWRGGEQSTTNGSTDTGYSPNSSKGGNGALPDDDPAFDIANRENRAVSLWRIVMLVVLVLTTIGVAFLVYTFVDNAEKYRFESSLKDDTLKIYESLGSSMDSKLAAVDSLAMLMVSSANEKNETFPFTTLTDFAVKAAKVRHVMFVINCNECYFML
jgi:hypothetical protein